MTVAAKQDEGLCWLGAAALVESGVINIREAREMLNMDELDTTRIARLRAAASWTKKSAFRLPGYALSFLAFYGTDTPD